MNRFLKSRRNQPIRTEVDQNQYCTEPPHNRGSSESPPQPQGQKHWTQTFSCGGSEWRRREQETSEHNETLTMSRVNGSYLRNSSTGESSSSLIRSQSKVRAAKQSEGRRKASQRWETDRAILTWGFWF